MEPLIIIIDFPLDFDVHVLNHQVAAFLYKCVVSLTRFEAALMMIHVDLYEWASFI